MESYLKEEDPVNLEWLEENLGWLEHDSKILNSSEVRNIYVNYSDFEQVIHLPNNRKCSGALDTVLKDFVEECTDDLNYFLSTEIDKKRMTVNIFILPIVESA